MKSTALFVLAALCFSTMAQESRMSFSSDQPKMALMPTLGVGSFVLSGKSGEKMELGPVAGLLIDLNAGRPTVLQTGVSYIEMGSMAFGMDYLALHVAGKAFTSDKHSGFFLKVGALPMIAIKKDANIKTNDFDVMAQVGLGFQAPASQVMQIGGELTLNRGLLDVDANEGKPSYNQGIMLNGFISL